MKTGYQFRFRFRQVKGSPVGFSNRTGDEEQEPEWLPENKPIGYTGLLINALLVVS